MLQTMKNSHFPDERRTAQQDFTAQDGRHKPLGEMTDAIRRLRDRSNACCIQTERHLRIGELPPTIKINAWMALSIRQRDNGNERAVDKYPVSR